MRVDFTCLSSRRRSQVGCDWGSVRRVQINPESKSLVLEFHRWGHEPGVRRADCDHREVKPYTCRDPARLCIPDKTVHGWLKREIIVHFEVIRKWIPHVNVIDILAKAWALLYSHMIHTGVCVWLSNICPLCFFTEYSWGKIIYLVYVMP